MSRREIQSEGKDVATAIIRGLNELGRRRDQVEVTVIQEEKSGFLGHRRQACHSQDYRKEMGQRTFHPYETQKRG